MQCDYVSLRAKALDTFIPRPLFDIFPDLSDFFLLFLINYYFYYFKAMGFGTVILPYLSVTAVASTIGLFLCGLEICAKIRRRGSTDGTGGAPFLIGWFAFQFFFCASVIDWPSQPFIKFIVFGSYKAWMRKLASELVKLASWSAYVK